jgi:hypothetical protein
MKMDRNKLKREASKNGENIMQFAESRNKSEGQLLCK